MSKAYKQALSYLSYSTIYQASGDINIGLGSHACFGSVLNNYRVTPRKQHYEVYLITDVNYSVNCNMSNLCMLTKSEVLRHIKLVRRLFPFKYSVEESNYGSKKAFKVILDVDAPYFYHKYLLTWLRYTYEFPYNIILNEALHLKHDDLKKESITNLFVLCANSFNARQFSYGGGHGIQGYRPAAFLKEYELRAKITEIAEKKERGNVNNIYPDADFEIKRIKVVDSDRYLEYWTDNEAFQTRKQVYLENYKKLRR